MTFRYFKYVFVMMHNYKIFLNYGTEYGSMLLSQGIVGDAYGQKTSG